MLLTTRGAAAPIQSPVHTSATLDAWVTRPWVDGVQVDTLRDLDVLRVATLNTIYEITLIEAASGHALVQGGRYFPQASRGVILGCSLGSAFLKVRGIYCGFCLEIYGAGTRIVTTPVQSVGIRELASGSGVQ